MADAQLLLADDAMNRPPPPFIPRSSLLCRMFRWPKCGENASLLFNLVPGRWSDSAKGSLSRHPKRRLCFPRDYVVCM